jgi:hypothetical protein
MTLFDVPAAQKKRRLAAGVSIGMIAAALVLFLVERYRTQMAFEEAAEVLQGLTKDPIANGLK